MVIHNEIFEYYRENKRQVEKAKTLLKSNGYIVYKKQKYGVTKNDKNNT